MPRADRLPLENDFWKLLKQEGKPNFPFPHNLSLSIIMLSVPQKRDIGELMTLVEVRPPPLFQENVMKQTILGLKP